MKKKTIREQVAEIIYGKELPNELRKYYLPRADAICFLIDKELPAPNRKSCDNSEHYIARFKDGWNACLRAVREVLR